MPLSKLPMEKLITTLLGGFVVSMQAFGQETKPLKPQAPQQPDEVIRIFTDLVQTDVMVFDKEGRFVNGLKREDFKLSIDGKPKPIEFFDRIAAGSTDEEAQLAAARGAAATKPAASVPLDRGRTIFFYVDDFHLSPGDLIFLRKALLKFIDNDLGQNDQAVITSGSGQIGFLQQLTDNKVVLRAAVSRINARPYAVQDRERPLMTEYQAMLIDSNPAAMSHNPNFPDLLTYFIQRTVADTGETPEAAEIHVRNRARAMLEQGAMITINTLAAFDSLVQSSSELPGRKLVFFISGGFLTDTRNSDASQRLEQITRRAARSGVVVYSMDARGLTAGLPTAADEVEVDSGTLARESKGELIATRDAMATLALDTGGRTIFDKNALEKGFVDAVSETSRYYILAWRSSHEAQTGGKKPRIEVSLINHPELKVRLRQSLFTTAPAKDAKSTTAKPDGEKQKSPEAKLRETLVGIYPTRDLPVALDLQFQNTRDKGMMLTASMQVPIDALSTTTLDGKEKALVDLGGFVYDDQGKVKGNFIERGSVMPAGPGSNTTQTEALTFNYSLSLSPGLYQIRVGARDVNSGKIGTAHEWIEIPDLSARELRLSTILAGERTASTQNESTQTPRINMRADHHYHRGASLHFQINIYNAKVGAGTSTPDLVMELQALRDRQPVITMPERQIAITSSQITDQIRTGGEFSLKDLTPGRYVLLITVIDRIAKTSASQQMRFEIE
jgi:VWFA-related protein